MAVSAAQILWPDAAGNCEDERQEHRPHPEEAARRGRCRSLYIALGDSRSSSQYRMAPDWRLPVTGVRVAKTKAAELGIAHVVASFRDRQQEVHESASFQGFSASEPDCNS